MTGGWSRNQLLILSFSHELILNSTSHWNAIPFSAGVGKYSWYVNSLQVLPYDFPSDFLLFHHCSNAYMACYRSSAAIYDNVWWVQTCSIVWHWAHIMLSFLLFQCHIVTRIKNVSEMIRVRSNRYSLNNSLVICLHISNDFLHIVKSTAPTTSPPNGNVSIVHGLCCISYSEEEYWESSILI